MLIDRWWCEDPPIRHIHLRAADGHWRLITTEGEAQPQQHDYASEADARASAHAIMEQHPGHWQRQPPSRTANPESR